MTTKNTAAISLPKGRTVRGYRIQRLALGGYLSAIQLLQDLPGELMELCFPGETLDAILEHCKKADTALVQRVLGRLLTDAPQHVIRAAAELTGTPEERLLNDPEIGLDGLVELLSAWVEVNRLGDFIPAVRRLIRQVRTASGSSPRPSSGSKG